MEGQVLIRVGSGAELSLIVIAPGIDRPIVLNCQAMVIASRNRNNAGNTGDSGGIVSMGESNAVILAGGDLNHAGEILHLYRVRLTGVSSIAQSAVAVVAPALGGAVALYRKPKILAGGDCHNPCQTVHLNRC